jgi:hypothetical protein
MGWLAIGDCRSPIRKAWRKFGSSAIIQKAIERAFNSCWLENSKMIQGRIADVSSKE